MKRWFLRCQSNFQIPGFQHLRWRHTLDTFRNYILHFSLELLCSLVKLTTHSELPTFPSTSTCIQMGNKGRKLDAVRGSSSGRWPNRRSSVWPADITPWRHFWCGPKAYTLYQQFSVLAFLRSSHMQKILLTICLATKILVYSKGKDSEKDYMVYYSYYKKTVNKCLSKRKSMYKTIICCCSIAKSWPTLCDPMDCSTPGLSVLHYLPEFAQTHIHWVDDAILYLNLNTNSEDWYQNSYYNF